MKSTLPLASLFVALAALPIGAINLVLATLRLGDSHDPKTIALAIAQAILGALQVIPGMGFVFALNRDVPWSPAKKAMWMLWVVCSAPLVTLSVAALVFTLLG